MINTEHPLPPELRRAFIAVHRSSPARLLGQLGRWRLLAGFGAPPEIRPRSNVVAVPDGLVGLAAKPNTDVLFALGTAESLRELRTQIETLDVPPPQIEVEAVWVDLRPAEQAEVFGPDRVGARRNPAGSRFTFGSFGTFMDYAAAGAVGRNCRHTQRTQADGVPYVHWATERGAGVDLGTVPDIVARGDVDRDGIRTMVMTARVVGVGPDQRVERDARMTPGGGAAASAGSEDVMAWTVPRPPGVTDGADGARTTVLLVRTRLVRREPAE